MNTLGYILLATGVVSLISLIGILVLSGTFLKKKGTTILLVSFAAGVLLSTALVNVLPEALEGMPYSQALLWFMGGIIGAFFLERFFVWYHHHHDATHNLNPTATLVVFGDAVHNFVDGLAIAAAFIVNPALGIATTIAIAAHEIPQEIADFSILKHTGLSTRKALLWNFASALFAIVGGIIGFYVFRESAELVYIALAITAGIFLYVSVADLIPELHSDEAGKSMLAQTGVFILGVLLMVFITSQAPHTHEHEGDSELHHNEALDTHDDDEHGHEDDEEANIDEAMLEQDLTEELEHSDEAHSDEEEHDEEDHDHEDHSDEPLTQ